LVIPCGAGPTTSSSGIIDRPFARIEGISARRMVRSAPPPEDTLGRRGGQKTFGVDQALTKSSAER
jgi:hypothetical protein